MTEIAEITALLKSNNLTEALDLADRYLTAHPDDAEALFLRGKIHWRLARAVEDFFNPDLLNP